MEKKTHILVVDDEQHILQLLRETLGLEGFAVTVAADGNSALARLAEQAPDLVLLDIRMPGLNGYQVLELIREKSEVPVIMLTGVLEPISVHHSVNLGADDYVRKPFSTPILLARITRIKSKLRRARGELRHTHQFSPSQNSILLLFKRRKPPVYAQWVRTVRVPIFTCATCHSMIQVQGVLTGTAVRLLPAMQLIHGGIFVMLLRNLGAGEMQVMVDHFKGGMTQYPPQ